MKKILFTLVAVLFIFASQAKANNYYLNNSAVDNMFANATEVQVASLLASANSNVYNLAGISVAAEKNAIVAAILAWFLGGFAIHRYYLGTKGSMFFYYFCTFGGIFGIVPLVDFVMLLVNSNDISPYINNEKFIMW